MAVMTAEQAVEAARGLTFEKVWAALMESRAGLDKLEKQVEETSREVKDTAREVKEATLQMKASQKETDRQIQETDRQIQETDRQIQETDREVKEATRVAKATARQMGDLHHTIGSMTEAMFYPKIWEKFRSLGYTFAHGENRKHWIDGKKHIAEADIYMENGEYAMLVEVKTTLREEHVDEHMERLSVVKKHLNKSGDRRKLLGAVGGAVVSESVKNYALKKGLYVLIQSGEAVMLAKTGKGFKAAVW